MKYSTPILALAAVAVAKNASPQPSDSEGTVEGAFTFQTKPIDEGFQTYATNCTFNKYTTVWLDDSILIDSCGRIGSIVANKQYQFDGPPQADAEYTGGFYLNKNGSLSIGDNYVFFNCKSGDFSNIYSESQGEQCKPVRIDTFKCIELGNVPHPEKRDTRDENLGPVSGTCSIPKATGSSTAMQPYMTAMPTSAPPSATEVPSSSTPAETATTPSTPDTTTPAPIAPIVNATNPIATGTAVQPPSPTGATSAPSPFTGAGAIVAAGQKVVLAIAGVAAFALF